MQIKWVCGNVQRARPLQAAFSLPPELRPLLAATHGVHPPGLHPWTAAAAAAGPAYGRATAAGGNRSHSRRQASRGMLPFGFKPRIFELKTAGSHPNLWAHTKTRFLV